MGHCKDYRIYGERSVNDRGVKLAFPMLKDTDGKTELPVVVSFACNLYPDLRYEAAIDALSRDCRSVGTDYDLYYMEPPDVVKQGKLSVRKWATHFKPVFMKEMLLKHRRPIWWLDCDARVTAQPEVVDIKYMMAVHYQPHRGAYPIRSAELWFNYCEGALKFLDQWESSLLPHLEDHTPLIRLWKSQNLAVDARVYKTNTKGWCVNNGTKIERV